MGGLVSWEATFNSWGVPFFRFITKKRRWQLSTNHRRELKKIQNITHLSYLTNTHVIALTFTSQFYRTFWIKHRAYIIWIYAKKEKRKKGEKKTFKPFRDVEIKTSKHFERALSNNVRDVIEGTEVERLFCSLAAQILKALGLSSFDYGWFLVILVYVSLGF